MSYGSSSPIAIWSVGVPRIPAACRGCLGALGLGDDVLALGVDEQPVDVEPVDLALPSSRIRSSVTQPSFSPPWLR